MYLNGSQHAHTTTYKVTGKCADTFVFHMTKRHNWHLISKAQGCQECLQDILYLFLVLISKHQISETY